MNLAQIQHAMQQHLLRGETAIEAAVVDDPQVGASRRLGIYAGAYVSRLQEALADSYPALRSVLGESAFEDLARGFVALHPSVHPSVRHYGEELAAYVYLQVGAPVGTVLSDLARWEWALAAAFDGPDSTPIDGGALAVVPPADWAELRFRFVGTLTRVTLQTNAVEWWRAVQRGESVPPSAAIAPGADWVIWRADLKVNFRSISPDEAWLLDAARDGMSFGALCESLATVVGDDAAPVRAATALRDWLASGWLADVDAAR